MKMIGPHIDFHADAILARHFHEVAADAERFAPQSRYWAEVEPEYRAKAEVKSGLFLDRYCS